jgi:hypothetical protein
MADVHGAFPIVARPLRLGHNIGEIQYQAKQAIRDAAEQRKGVGGCKGHPHLSGCEALRSGSSSDCVYERGELGKIRLRNVDSRHLLLRCVRKSGRANIVGTLEQGWVQDSCIISSK